MPHMITKTLYFVFGAYKLIKSARNDVSYTWVQDDFSKNGAK